MFSYEYCEILKTDFFYETTLVAASDLVKSCHRQICKTDLTLTLALDFSNDNLSYSDRRRKEKQMPDIKSSMLPKLLLVFMSIPSFMTLFIYL